MEKEVFIIGKWQWHDESSSSASASSESETEIQLDNSSSDIDAGNGIPSMKHSLVVGATKTNTMQEVLCIASQKTWQGRRSTSSHKARTR